MRRTFSWLEIIIQCYIVCVAITSMDLVTRWIYVQNSIPNDWLVYYLAGRGEDFSRFIYNIKLAPLFGFLNWFPPLESYSYWAGIRTFCFMILVHKMFEVKYGWIPILIALPEFESLLKVGNVEIILDLAALSPITALLACMVKPYHAVFMVLAALKTDGRDLGRGSDMAQGESHSASAGVVSGGKDI